MKTKLLLTLLALLGIGIPMQAEDEVFPKSDAIWVIHAYKGVLNPEQLIFGLKGDTVINTLTYNKLYLLNDTILNIDDEDMYVAGIRQSDKKVYVLPAKKGDGAEFDEFIMYDFSKNVGDRVSFSWLVGDFCPPINDCEQWITHLTSEVEAVVETDSRKTFLLNQGGDRWIEGIGSLYGLFCPNLGFPSGPGGPLGNELICMKYQDKMKYLAEDCTSCFEQDFKYSSLDEDKIDQQIAVGYNSTSKSIEINFGDFSPNIQFSLYTSDGKLIDTFPLTDTQTNLNTTYFYRGLYLYKVVGEGISRNGKLIIQ